MMAGMRLQGKAKDVQGAPFPRALLQKIACFSQDGDVIDSCRERTGGRNSSVAAIAFEATTGMFPQSKPEQLKTVLQHPTLYNYPK